MNVLLVDDHVFLRDGVAIFLEQTFPTIQIYQANNCTEAFKIAHQYPLNLVLLDLKYSTRGHEGMDALIELKRTFKSLCIVIFSGVDYDQELVFEVLKNGAMGFLPKDLPRREDFEAALRQVLSGFPYIPASIVGAKGNSSTTNILDANGFLDSTNPSTLCLTDRQFEILRWLVHHGISNNEIAKKLGIAEQTVKNHLSAIFNRFNVGTRHKLIIEVNKLGIILGEPDVGNKLNGPE